MDLKEAEGLAWELIEQFLSAERGRPWQFRFTRSIRALGVCNYLRRYIGLSKPYTELNPRAVAEETIRHEIAHVLAGPGVGHGPTWQKRAVEVGASPVARCRISDLVQPPRNWMLLCPRCRAVTPCYRRQRRRASCSVCGGKKFDPAYELLQLSREDFAADAAELATIAGPNPTPGQPEQLSLWPAGRFGTITETLKGS